MPTQLAETEDQRRRRVTSRIRNELFPHIRSALIEAARKRKLADEWLTPEEVNLWLEDRGVWASHPDVMAGFLSESACEEVVETALNQLTFSHPDLWVNVGNTYKPAGRDWNAYAVRKASLIRRQFPLAERTAYHTGCDGASVLFAHDDYQRDSRAKQEVALLRKFLAENQIPELGFGVSEDGKTWVMVVFSEDPVALEQALFDAWQMAFSVVEEIQF